MISDRLLGFAMGSCALSSFKPTEENLTMKAVLIIMIGIPMLKLKLLTSKPSGWLMARLEADRCLQFWRIPLLRWMFIAHAILDSIIISDMEFQISICALRFDADMMLPWYKWFLKPRQRYSVHRCWEWDWGCIGAKHHDTRENQTSGRPCLTGMMADYQAWQCRTSGNWGFLLKGLHQLLKQYEMGKRLMIFHGLRHESLHNCFPFQ